MRTVQAESVTVTVKCAGVFAQTQTNGYRSPMPTVRLVKASAPVISALGGGCEKRGGGCGTMQSRGAACMDEVVVMARERFNQTTELQPASLASLARPHTQ